MAAAGERTPDEPRSPRWFATTHWTVVLNAGSGDAGRAADALESLCRTYWLPINRFIRGRGYSEADADDLTQQFFAKFLERQQYRTADPARGRFRSYLLTSVKNFLIKEHERAVAQKRGGGLPLLSLDQNSSEESTSLQVSDEQSAERIFEREWGLALLTRARARLEAEYAAEGRAERFVHLEKFLPGQENEMTGAEVAQLLGVAPGTIKSDVHRLKRRYATFVREEVAHTLAAPNELEDELRHLRAVLAGSRA